MSGYLRLFIKVRDKFYYDIGLRKRNMINTRTMHQMGHKCPRFLEDFISAYGSKHITVLDYGKLIDEKEYIDKVLE